MMLSGKNAKKKVLTMASILLVASGSLVLSAQAKDNVYLYEDDTVSVKAVVGSDSGLSDDAKLMVTTFEEGSAEYTEATDKVKGYVNLQEENEKLDFTPYDIYFMDEGERVEPESGSVFISLSSKDEGENSESEGTVRDRFIAHVLENGEVERLENLSENGGVEFHTTSFSIMGPASVLSLPEEDAYAILYENGTMVFQRGSTPDESMGAVVGTYTGFEVDSYSVGNAVPWKSYRGSITSVVIKDKTTPISTAYWFFGCQNLVTIEGLSNLNTSDVTNMRSMFDGCGKLTSLDLSSFDTTNVTNMRSMFEGCVSLTSLDLSSFDTTNVTNMNSMFFSCSGLTDLNVSSFDTTNVTKMVSMFRNCKSLTSIDLSSFNTVNVVGMTEMFRSCSKLINLDLSSFDTINVTDMGRMFHDCSGLTSLDLSSFNTTNVTAMYYMFTNCSSLTSLDLHSFDTSNVKSMNAMFSGCSKLISLDLSSFDTTNVTALQEMFSSCRSLTSLDLSGFDTINVTRMDNMFNGCLSLTSLDLSSFDTTNVTRMDSMFNGCPKIAHLKLGENWKFVGDTNYLPYNAWKNLETGEIYNPLWTNYDGSTMAGTYVVDDACAILYDSGKMVMQRGNVLDETEGAYRGIYTGFEVNSYSSKSDIPWLDNRYTIGSVIIKDRITPVSTCDWFYQMGNLKSIEGLENLDTSNVISMRSMFSDCAKLVSLDLSSFDTTNVTSMGYMFNGCKALTSLDLSSFDTTNVTNMSFMFYSCSALTSLDLSGFDTINVTNMNSMFYSCFKLTSLDLSNFNTANVTDMDSMFYNCSALTSLDLSGFDTTNVTNMTYMFNTCQALTSLDLSNFDTTNVTYMTYMFVNCSKLSLLTLGSDWNFVGSTNYLPKQDWVRASTGELISDLWNNYDGSTMADTYGCSINVTFNAIGGTGTKTIATTGVSKYGVNTIVPDPKREGYTFAGWYTSAFGGEELKVGDYTSSSVYYAHWVPNSYKLILRSNGTSESDVEVDMTYGSFYSLSDDVFHKEGYILSSWNDKRNGSGVSYASNETVGNLDSTVDGKYILYAQWTSVSKYATVSFDTDGGNAVEPITLLKGSKLGKISTTLKENYTFINWHIGSLTGTEPAESTIINEDTVLYAEFKKDPIVTFVGGIVSNQQRRVKYNTEVGTLPSYAPNSNRYMSLIGWFTEETGGTQIDSTTVITEDVTYYAHWGWTPKFNTNGGKITSDTEYPFQDNPSYAITTLPTVVRDGYNFVGWFLGDGITEVHDGDIIDLSQGIEIFAKWEIGGTYTITLDKNGGNYGYPTEIKIYEGNVITGLYEPTRSEYQFVGWMTDEGVYYNNGDTLSSDITLKAQWKQNDVTVKFNPESSVGTGTMYSSSKTRKIPAGTTINTIPGALLTNYVLDGWYTEKDGAGEKLTTDTIINENVTYYAYYKPTLTTYNTDDFTYTFGAEWTNASSQYVDNVNGNLEWHYTGSGSSKITSTLHLRFELNKSVGTNVLPTGSVKIRVPKYIWKDWDGNWVGTNNVSANLPKYPNTGNMYFSYLEDGDDYILINNRDISGGTGLDMTISYSVYSYQVPGGAMDYLDGQNKNYIDGYDFYKGEVPVTATVDVDYTDDNEYVADMTETVVLTDEMHTYVDPTALDGYPPRVYYTWDSSWGEKPADDDEYFYIKWSLKSSLRSNQPYSIVWNEGTVHDGSVLGWVVATGLNDADTEETRVGNTSNGIIQFSYALLKYPKSLLKDIPESGLVISNSAVLKTTWKSGYVQEQYVTDSVTIYDSEYPRGEFDKNNGNTLVKTISGGNEDLVYDDKEVFMHWSLKYDGGSVNSPITWDEDSKAYSAPSRVIEFTDGAPGDVMYSSGSASSKYVWEPNTGNVTLTDNDYYISSIMFTLEEYDAEQNEGMWSSRFLHSNYSDYDGVGVYIRYANSDEWVLYKMVYFTYGSSDISLKFPEGVVGYKLRHKTDFYSTRLQSSGTFRIKPTNHVVSLVSSDMSLNTTSIFKDKAVCNIWEADDETMTPYFTATDYTGGNNPANKECYELTKSNYYQYTYKNAGSADTVIFDATEGIQDNKMTIAGWNYSTSSSRKIPMTSGTFYDLLPAGTNVLESTINGSYTTANHSSSWSPSSGTGNELKKELYNVRFEKNWEGSNRTMMVIDWNAPKGVNVTGVVFTYMLRNTYANIIENGTSLENDVAFVNTSTVKTVPYRKSGNQSVITEKSLYDSLQSSYSDFISYAKVSTNYIPVDAYSWGYDKSVNTDGSYVKENAVTVPNNEYTYKLEFSQSDNAKATDIVFYDILEYGADRKIDGVNQFIRSDWHGVLKNIDISMIASKSSNGSTTVKCAPVIYYSTKNKEDFIGSDYDVTNTETWTSVAPSDLSTVTAIAIDCRKATDGSDFIFKDKDALSVYVTMVAPVNEEAYGKIAYNTSVVYARQGDAEVITPITSDASVTLKDVNPELHKVSNPESGTQEEPAEVFIDTTLKYTLSVKNTDDEVTVKNVIIEDTIPDGLVINYDRIRFSLSEGEEGVLISDSPRASVRKSGRKLTFTINSLDPQETAYVTVPTMVNIDDGLIVNTSKITSVNGIDKEINSETTYHKAVPVPDDGVKVKVNKVNKEGNLIGGAVLQITGRSIYASEDIEPIEWTTVEGESFEVSLEPGNYVLHEISAPEGYVLNPFDVEFTVKDKDLELEMFNSEETTFEINKTWNDGEDSGLRPDTITFELYQDGVYLKDVTVSKADDYHLVVDELQKYSNDEGHAECVYTVKEKTEDYDPEYTYSEDNSSVTVKNTLLTKKKGIKTWNDNNDASRPSSIVVRLLQNGVEYKTQEVSEATNWAYEFIGLPKYNEEGVEYSYSVKEGYIKGYSVGYTQAEADGLAISLDYQTESTSYDWFYIYYYNNGKLYRTSKYGGNTRKQVTINIPATEFWLEFRSDSSSCSYYGVKVTDVQILETAPSILGSTVSFMTNGYTEIEAADFNEIETLPHGNYGNNVTKRWHYVTSGGGSGLNITNTKLTTDFTKVQISKVDEEGNPVVNAHLQLLDSKDEVIKDWVTESTPEKFDGIEAGTYTLHEVTAPEGYRVAPDMSIEILDSTELQSFTMVDKLDVRYNLSVSKTVKGSGGSKVKDFRFKLKLSGSDSYPDEISYTVKEEGIADITGTMAMTSGEGTFTLHHGQTITFAEVPGGLDYEVSETDAEDHGYTVESTNASGVLEEDTQVTFINKKDMVVPTSSDTNIRVLLGLAGLAGIAFIFIARRFKRRRKAKN